MTQGSRIKNAWSSESTLDILRGTYTLEILATTEYGTRFVHRGARHRVLSRTTIAYHIVGAAYIVMCFAASAPDRGVLHSTTLQQNRLVVSLWNARPFLERVLEDQQRLASPRTSSGLYFYTLLITVLKATALENKVYMPLGCFARPPPHPHSVGGRAGPRHADTPVRVHLSRERSV